MFRKKKERNILVKFTLHDSIDKDTPKYYPCSSGYSGRPPKATNKFTHYPASSIRLGYILTEWDGNGTYVRDIDGCLYHLKYVKTLERL